MGILHELFDIEQFMPHGHCFLWIPKILWMHIIGDVTITLAYYSIPLTLLYLMIKRRQTIPYRWIVGLYAAFIFLCGTTHIVSVITLWLPIYYFEGVLKIITGVVSLATAMLMFPLASKLLDLFKENKELKEEQ